MNWRVKSLDDILATAEKKSLHRTLGAFQLTMLGIGCVIGTGIFVLTAEAAQKAGPGMMVSFVIAGFVCAVTALCYAELTAMVPVAGSAYTYSYAVLGEVIAWIVGWALILEYAIAASAVCVGWSNYFSGFAQHFLGWDIGVTYSKGPFDGGLINLPAVVIAAAVTTLLYIGTRESATVNAVLVVVKVLALTVFIALTIPVMHASNFEPFTPLGFGGVAGAAASIFFAYVGFDAVSTAAEETRNPQRNVPIGLVGSLIICTVFYLLVSAGAIGSIGAQPVIDPATGQGLATGSVELAHACLLPANHNALACSHEALAHVLRQIGSPKVAALIGLAAFVALPSVILILIFGQTRIFFVMSRDGLLPPVLSKVHPRFKTPYVVTVLTGIGVVLAAAFFPVGKLADVSNAGTLFAFLTVAIGVMTLRRRQPQRKRPFRTPAIWITGPLAIGGCIFLFFSLGLLTQLVFIGWAAFGLLVYVSYSRRRSHLGISLQTP
jgi:basic amino acid/polyamine antiporter, APA family